MSLSLSLSLLCLSLSRSRSEYPASHNFNSNSIASLNLNHSSKAVSLTLSLALSSFPSHSPFSELPSLSRSHSHSHLSRNWDWRDKKWPPLTRGRPNPTWLWRTLLKTEFCFTRRNLIFLVRIFPTPKNEFQSIPLSAKVSLFKKLLMVSVEQEANEGSYHWIYD